MKPREKVPQPNKDQRQRLPYRAPRLTLHGTVPATTLDGSSGPSDAPLGGPQG